MTDETMLSPIQEALPGTIDRLLERIRSMPRRRRRRAWLLSGATLIAFIAETVWLGTAGYLNESPWPILAALVLTIVSGIGIWMVAERREMRTIEALAACKEIRALGGLLESVNSSDRRTAKVVQTALLELLPHLTEDHSTLLGTTPREALNALLYGKSSELAMAALSALEQVGDGTALPYLTSIAAGKGVPGTLRDRKSEVQERARNAVERIRTRIDIQNRANVLLRAAQAPEAPSGQLVRPAYSRPIIDGRELLRPEAGSEQDPDQKEEML